MSTAVYIHPNKSASSKKRSYFGLTFAQDSAEAEIAEDDWSPEAREAAASTQKARGK